MNLKQARTLCQIGAVFLTLTACTRTVERIKPVPYAVPVAAPCPKPADVQPLPAKPDAPLPDDANAALAFVLRWVADLWPWAQGASAQLASCSSISNSGAASK